MKFKPLQPESDNVRGQATSSDAPPVSPEPSHIHIPRPSRVRLELARQAADHAMLEPAA